jgi:hypothetical protein
MSPLFLIHEFPIKEWCTSLMSLEDLAIQSITTSASSFVGTVVFWVWFCPNHRCCRLPSIRNVLERTKE